MQQTFGEIRLVFSVKGNMENAVNMVNEFGLDLGELEEKLKSMGVEVTLHDVNIDYEKEE